MELNHLHLMVREPERSTLFYMRCLGYELHDRYGSEMILRSPSGTSILVLSPQRSGHERGDSTLDHFGFAMESQDDLNSVVATMQRHGARLIETGMRGQSAYAFLVNHDSHQIELTVRA